MFGTLFTLSGRERTARELKARAEEKSRTTEPAKPASERPAGGSERKARTPPSR